MNQQQILMLMSQNMADLSRKRIQLDELNKKAIGGQSVAYMISIQEGLDDGSRAAAKQLFTFFTVSVLGYTLAKSAIRTVTSNDFRRIMLPPSHTFSEDHRKLIEGDNLKLFTEHVIETFVDDAEEMVEKLCADLLEKINAKGEDRRDAAA